MAVFYLHDIHFAVTANIKEFEENRVDGYEPDYAGLQGVLLGEISNELSFPAKPSIDFESYKIPVGTSVYTIDPLLAEERGMSFCGLLLETVTGNVYFAYPFLYAGDAMEETDIEEKVLNAFYRGNSIDD